MNQHNRVIQLRRYLRHYRLMLQRLTYHRANGIRSNAERTDMTELEHRMAAHARRRCEQLQQLLHELTCCGDVVQAGVNPFARGWQQADYPPMDAGAISRLENP